MKRILYIYIMALSATILASCEHDPLCLNHDEHALKYHINLAATWRLDWEENVNNHKDWEANWPQDYLPYNSLRPTKPDGLRVVNNTKDGATHVFNISPDGGLIYLSEGTNNMLLYNNNTEYIVFTEMNSVASTRATTRTRTRATYSGNPFDTRDEQEETVNPPDMLFGNYIEGYVPEKLQFAPTLETTLHPLVFTYKIRFEFSEGLEYVALARGALSGMAMSVQMSTGKTSDEVATILYDCEVTDFGARALVNSFGAPGFPNPNYTKGEPIYGLNLEVRMKNGVLKSFDFDITDQIKAQPHGGVITVSGLKITKEEGTSNTGGFSVDINDWGEYEDIEIPLI